MAQRSTNGSLRILFIAGGLGYGGAEKQFVYMLRALKNVGAEIKVLSLTEGESHEQSLRGLGIHPISIARENPIRRLAAVIQTAREFQPHFIQATHFFATAYAGLAGRAARIPSIGAIRGDFHHDLARVGRAGRLIAALPTILLANSNNARSNALSMGISPDRVQVLPNVIDLQEFDRLRANGRGTIRAGVDGPNSCAITVARLMPVKRLERFLQALAIARQQIGGLQGVIVGSGPEETALRDLAVRLDLHPGGSGAGVVFLGERQDIPALLGQADLYVLTSQREGFPNVLLEAMAASLPVIATPAGETPELISEGKTGFIIPFDDVQALAERMVILAQSPDLRGRMGAAGRQRVEQQYGFARLGENMMRVYQDVARQRSDRSTLHLIETILQAFEHSEPSPLYSTPQS